MNATETTARCLYWVSADKFDSLKAQLEEDGYTLNGTRRTACQLMLATERELMFAPPEVWSGMCNRQGSWYRISERNGQFAIMSRGPLPEYCRAYLDAEMTTTDFEPEKLPDDRELEVLVRDAAYVEQKPSQWEQLKKTDALVAKLFFTFNRVWKWGDNMGKHWLGHRANHANFLAKKFTTEVDGVQVAYSVTDNAGVCSSCAEFFNVVDPANRKLVRACPGSVTFGKTELGTYYDVKPVKPV